MSSAPPAAKTPASGAAAARRIFRVYLAPRWRELAVSMVCAAFVAGLTASLAQVLGKTVQALFVDKAISSLWIYPALIGVLALARGMAQVGQASLVNKVGNQMVGQIQVQLFARLVRADLAQLREAHSGAHLSSILYEAGLVREAATNGLVNYVQNALTIVATVVVMLQQDVGLTLVVLVGGPIASGVMTRYSRRTRKAAQGAMTETSALSTAVMESLDGVKIVKIENREGYEEQRVAEVVARREAHLIKGANARATAAPATEAVMTLITAAVIAFAGWRALNGAFTVGNLTAFLAAIGMASQSLRQVANLQTVMGEGLAAAEQLFAALDTTPEIKDAPGAVTLPRSEGHIALTDVTFVYSPDVPALSGVTLEARRGETIALVGPSGGGKSTILNLIPRFFDVQSGSVSIDGHDVRNVTLASLRNQIALVTQEPFLFDDTIRGNIAYARPQASPGEIEQAAKAAAAHEFIMALPQGYDTPVGELGSRLSGGQRQRIAIARAFLKDAPLLLLDEATSALDTESEAKVQEALERLMAGRTAILIAHRLSTVRGADRIYVIDRGRVVETGHHESLMARHGLYARLARSQQLDEAVADPDQAT
ncbi:MAG TPA: ABC transporter ATP-binding protein [Caulobacteraceae bacterium]|nr:ABC transporter ATP-binding protein [Caulobacteraceae bacterium]